MGLVPASGGDILLDGRSLRGQAPEAIARKGVSLVPEGRRIFAELTVEENLRLGLAARRTRNGEAFDDVYELFPVVREMRGRQAGAISGGAQQPIANGRGLASRA